MGKKRPATSSHSTGTMFKLKSPITAAKEHCSPLANPPQLQTRQFPLCTTFTSAYLSHTPPDYSTAPEPPTPNPPASLISPNALNRLRGRSTLAGAVVSTSAAGVLEPTTTAVVTASTTTAGDQNRVDTKTNKITTNSSWQWRWWGYSQALGINP